ncbi:LmbE family protein [Flammeovirgaceae bacterium 311]|nr:LmbE family protein [Flammeovirgaceae bacterium 311]
MAFERSVNNKFLTCLLLGLFCGLAAIAQKPPVQTSSDIQLALQKLEVLGSVLYLAAHPDDENTRLIAWLANEKKYRTAYLSLTRGDGGQNLIGSELRERLGLIRTQELLQARQIDGGTQFFTRANDFGFSKHPDETFQIWDKEAVLADVVWVIRKFKPDVIITRFSTEPGVTHGHHTASAILAAEAFKAAADPRRFPEQLKYLQTWQPKRLLWNTSSWFFRGREEQFDTTGLLQLNIGGYNPLLGKSYPELAAESRSMHRSQGFGAALSRENASEYLMPILGEAPQGGNLLAGINTDWSRVSGGDKIAALVRQLQHRFDPLEPGRSISELVQLYKAIQSLPENPYKNIKLEEVEEIIRASAGLYAEASTGETGVAPASEVAIKLEAVNRSANTVKLVKISLPAVKWDSTLNLDLQANEPRILNRSITIPAHIPPSQPYWLVQEPGVGMYKFEQVEMTGQAENPAPINVTFTFLVEGLELSHTVPLVHKHVNPAVGELYQPFVVTPPVMVTPVQDQLIFANDEPQQLFVRVRAGKDFGNGNLNLGLPEGWRSEPAAVSLENFRKGEERSYQFQIIPPKKAGSGAIKVFARLDGSNYSKGYETIVAPHFPVQTLFPEAKIGVIRMDLKREGDRIGYIMGAGDAVPSHLERVGFSVSILDPAAITAEQLGQYDAVVLGIRAFNTQEVLRHNQKALEDYARGGGVVVIQYNTSHELVTQNIAPYALQLGRGRVTNELAPVKLLLPNHPALNYPNKITGKDFEGWVQERGLYFADSWSAEWQPLIASNDLGEQPLEGGLLVAPVGSGYYVYGAYSWFRQLPAGVPGAYRLLANLLALGKTPSK